MACQRSCCISDELPGLHLCASWPKLSPSWLALSPAGLAAARPPLPEGRAGLQPTLPVILTQAGLGLTAGVQMALPGLQFALPAGGATQFLAAAQQTGQAVVMGAAGSAVGGAGGGGLPGAMVMLAPGMKPVLVQNGLQPGQFSPSMLAALGQGSGAQQMFAVLQQGAGSGMPGLGQHPAQASPQVTPLQPAQLALPPQAQQVQQPAAATPDGQLVPPPEPPAGPSEGGAGAAGAPAGPPALIMASPTGGLVLASAKAEPAAIAIKAEPAMELAPKAPMAGT